MRIKNSLINKLLQLLDQKIEVAVKAIESAKESRNNDTKSSAGDKYETGRAMMQLEIEKNEVQLNKALNLKKDIARIDCSKKYNKVEFGSLVSTNKENYFISIGVGKIEIDKQHYYAISLASPIGHVLQNKVIGDTFKFQNREFEIKTIE
jgi:transcription elongation GreA/GreB family factor